jgi:hypothetical protein
MARIAEMGVCPGESVDPFESLEGEANPASSALFVQVRDVLMSQTSR